MFLAHQSSINNGPGQTREIITHPSYVVISSVIKLWNQFNTERESFLIKQFENWVFTCLRLKINLLFRQHRQPNFLCMEFPGVKASTGPVKWLNRWEPWCINPMTSVLYLEPTWRWKKRTIPQHCFWPHSPSAKYIPKENEINPSRRYLSSCAPFSIIHSSPSEPWRNTTATDILDKVSWCYIDTRLVWDVGRLQKQIMGAGDRARWLRHLCSPRGPKSGSQNLHPAVHSHL